jgi:hypothetical protein
MELTLDALELFNEERALTGGDPCGVTCMLDSRCDDTVRPVG